MPPDVHDVARRVHARLLRDSTGWPGPTAVESLVRSTEPLLGHSVVADAVAAVTARATGLGPLEALLADPTVTDVLVNGPGEVWIERGGRLERSGVEVDHEALALLVERVVAPLDLRADRTAPVVDARLADGSRVHVVMPPVAVDGPYLSIRRFGTRTLPLTAFCPRAVASLLTSLVQRRWNLVVSGGTGAGKTTLLNALASALPEDARVVTIEDTAELRLPAPHVVRLEARPATAEGTAATTIEHLVRTALRMRPDHIVVGEVRGPEALDMLQAMNTGHAGSLTTCHANGPEDALRRLEAMAAGAPTRLPVAVVREHLVAAVDAVVHVARHHARRAVTAVAEVVDDPGAPRRTRLLADRHDVVATPRRPDRGAT